MPAAGGLLPPPPSPPDAPAENPLLSAPRQGFRQVEPGAGQGTAGRAETPPQTPTGSSPGPFPPAALRRGGPRVRSRARCPGDRTGRSLTPPQLHAFPSRLRAQDLAPLALDF